MNFLSQRDSISIRRGGNLASESAPVFQGEPETKEEAGKSKIAVKIFDAVISVSLFFIYLGVPLFFLGLTYQGIVFEKQLYFYFWILLAVVAWAAKGVIAGEMKIRRTPLDIPIIAFLAVYILATIFSIDRWHSFFGFFGDPSRGLMSVVALVVSYFLVLSHFTPKRLKLFIVAICTSGFILSLWLTLGIMGLKFLPGKIINFAPLSLIGSISGAGAYLAMLIPFYITILFITRSDGEMKPRLKNILTGGLLFSLALAIFLLLALSNYIPWVALLIGIGVFLMYILSRVVRPSESWTWLPMAIFVVIMAILMIGAVKIAKVNLPMEVSPAFQISSQIAKGALSDNFILGSGPATYGYDFSLHRPQDFNQNYFYNLRFYQGTGVISEALATVGVLGTIALMLVLLTFLSVGFYLLSREREKNKIYSLGFFSAVLIFVIYSVMTRVEGTMVIFGALLAALAMAVILWESESNEKYLNLTLKASPKYALALAFIFMVITAGVAYLFVFTGKTLTADLYAGSAVREQQPSEEGSITKLAKAANLYPLEGRYFTRIGQEYMVLANSEMLKGEEERDLKKIQLYLNNSIAAGVRGRDLAKNDVLSAESLAQIYENAGLYVADSLNLAEETYTQAQSLEPHNPNYLVKLGQIKVTQASASKDNEEKKSLIGQAKDLFQKSIDEKNNFDAGYYQLALAQEALADLDNAIDNMKKAFQLDNSNITYAFNLARLYQARGAGDDNKIAEDLFKQILGVNSKEINTHFSLGILYEKTGRKSDALSEYQKVLELLPATPAGGSGNSVDAKDSVQRMIDNLQNGVSNLNQNNNPAPEQQPVQ